MTHCYLKSLSISSGRLDESEYECIKGLLNIEAKSDAQSSKVRYVLEKLNNEKGVKVDASWVIINDFDEFVKKTWAVLWRIMALVAIILFVILASTKCLCLKMALQ